MLFCLLYYFFIFAVDYSSIYFDYILSEKQVVFFNYDLEEYLKDSREMYFDYDEYTPGRKVATFEELKTAILDVFDKKDDYIVERNKMIDKMFSCGRWESSSRFVQKVKEVL